MSEVRLNKSQQQDKALFDILYLSKILGYDFQDTAHGEELLRSVGPPIISTGKLKEPVPFFELSPVKNRLILWSRGHLKTSAAVVYIVNLILAYPDIRVLLMQATSRNTRGLLREIKSHFDGNNQRSKLPTIFPEFCKTDARLGTADGFVSPARKRTHLKEWTCGVASPKSVKTGQHYDFMLADDLVTDVNFRSKEQQLKVIEDFNNFTPLIEPGGYKSVSGTRYSFGDLYGHILRMDADRREWNISIKNCWKDGDRANGVLFPQVKTEDGRTIGFTPELLDKIRQDDPAIFSCQYLNQPLIAGQQLFTEEMLMAACKLYAPAQYPLLGPATLFADLGGHKRDNDPSVVVCGRLDHAGQMYVCDVRSGTKSQLDLAHTIIEMAMLHRPSTVQIEGTAAGNYFCEYLRMVAAAKGVVLQIMPIKVSNVKDAKDLRISAIEGVIRMKRLYFLFGLPKWEDIVEEFTQWPRGRHDDHIDTIGLMVQYYTQNVDMFSIRPVQSFHQFIVRSEPTTLITETFKDVSDEETCGGFLS